ncbi:MAG: ketoacyl-ACP synthase III [Paludibacteraceae bacterium]|nr:ketoacyl-ACP synthase III [Candidatus Physcocola equi]MCQ2233943.1 ketoacyl-ACP synthase III [Paludibacteraceae bacterium]
MGKINAVITGVGAFLPDYVLTNDELSRMVDTNDEWITTRVGIKERRIEKDPQKPASFLGTKAVENLFERTHTNPDEIELVICATSTPDHIFPATAAYIAENCGIKHALCFDVQAACAGFLTAYTIASNFIESGRKKKVLVVTTEKMSFMVDYTDRATCPLFGDGAGAVLIEGNEEGFGLIDSEMRTDGAGTDYLQMKAGGSAKPASHETVDAHEHFVYQEGKVVFKHAVTNMCATTAEVMERNNLKGEDLRWFIPHQANLRIIEAVGERVAIPSDRVYVNIQKYGNTSSATIPICLWEMQNNGQLKKGDKIVCTTFGAGFTFGAIYIKWGYDTDK